jgi:hypothetical protein
MSRRPLNLKRYHKHDVVRHYRSGAVYVVLGGRWRSECLNLLDPVSGDSAIFHPSHLDPCEEEMLVLAALAAL